MRTTARPKIVTLTDAAATRLREILVQNSEAAGLRLGVKKGGCAGLEYDLSLVPAPEAGDEVVEDKGAKLFIAPTAVLYLLGAEMDYQEGKMQSGFVFNNPLQTGACGCGASVAISPASETDLIRLRSE
jgi:iron-sulfur cluster assembly protein